MKILVSAGHGEGAPGACYWGLTEAGLMAELRNYVAIRLRERGHDVRTDGDGLINRALAHALTLISGTDVAIELHTNASVDASATGVEVVSLKEHKALAQKIAMGIASATGLRLRGLAGWRPPEETPHKQLAFCSRGGLVVETFFLSNGRDLAAYRDNKHDVAEAIAAAVSDD